MVQPIDVQTIRHGAGDGRPAAAGLLPLRPALRRVRPAHHSGMVAWALTSSDLLRRPV